MTDTDDTTVDSDSTLQDIPWWRIANVVGLLLLVAIVLPFVIYAVPQVVGAEHSYVVLSGSMEPAMSPGDVVIVNSVAASNIEKGDIITFRKGGEARPTTHRVIEVTQQGGSPAFRTKGDANEDPDSSLVTPGEIQGRVMSVGGYLFVIPYMGYVINFINTQLGFVLLFAVPITLLVINEIWNVIVAARTDQDSGDGNEAEAEDGAIQADAPDAGGTATAAGADTGTSDQDAEVAANAAETESVESDDAGITFSAAELQLGLVVLAAFLAYSIWVTYKTTEIWAFGVTGGVGASFLLLSGFYFFGGSSTDSADAPTDDAGAAGAESAGPEQASDSAPAPATETSSADGEGGDPARSGDIDPDVELNLLEEVVGQPTDEGTKPATGSIHRQLSDGGSTPEETGEDSQGTTPETGEGAIDEATEVRGGGDDE